MVSVESWVWSVGRVKSVEGFGIDMLYPIELRAWELAKLEFLLNNK